jgi:glycosyltransferase involved in cell wall biosynthesis
MTTITNWVLIKNFKYHIQHYDYLRDSIIRHFKLKSDTVWTVRSGTFDLFGWLGPHDNGYQEYVLFFGRISPYKGLPFLVKAFVEYAKQNERMNLVIAGEGNIQDLAPYMEAEPRIALINRQIPPHELAGLVHGCRAVVCPYTDATHSAVIMVSYAFNKPVLVHNVGGLKEVVIDKKTGLLMENLEVNTIVSALMALDSDPFSNGECQKYISELRKNGFISWKSIAREYVKVYAKVSGQ